jgi:hypothetical protein
MDIFFLFFLLKILLWYLIYVLCIVQISFKGMIWNLLKLEEAFLRCMAEKRTPIRYSLLFLFYF